MDMLMTILEVVVDLLFILALGYTFKSMIRREVKDFLKSESCIHVKSDGVTEEEMNEIKEEMLDVIKKHGLRFEEVTKYGK